MRPYSGVEDGLLLAGFVAELDGDGEPEEPDEPGEAAEPGEADAEGVLGDGDAEGLASGCEKAGTSDCEPVLAAALTFDGTDWLFCSAAVT